MKTKEEYLIGCEHDGSYIPVSEVLRLMESYAKEKAIEFALNSILPCFTLPSKENKDRVERLYNEYLKSKQTMKHYRIKIVDEEICMYLSGYNVRVATFTEEINIDEANLIVAGANNFHNRRNN